MNKLRLILLCVAVIGTVLSSSGQQEWQGAESTHAVKIGTTKPIRDVLPRTPTDAMKFDDWKHAKPEYVRNFLGRRQESLNRTGTLPQGPDPLMQNGQTRDGSIGVTPLVNVEGMNFQVAGAGVPDVNGDVSSQFYIQTVNSTWLQVYDLLGNKVGNPFRANTIWQQLGFTSAGDPVILYDNQAGRWFLTEFPSSNRVLVGVSDTNDPMGTWTAYAFSTPRFPDYPKWGIWSNAYVLTTNEGGGTIKFYTMNREEILSGADVVSVQNFTIPRFGDPSWQTAQPVDWNGSMDVAEDTHPMIMRINDDAYGSSPVDQVEVYEINVDWEDAQNSVVTMTAIPTAPYDSEFCSATGFGFACVPQPNGQGIDGIPYIFMNACQYRNFGTHSSIVGNFTVDVTGDDDGGIRWVELRKVGEGDWELYQEGTVGSEEGLNRFMGGISIDSKGNIGLAYSVSSESKFPSLRFSGRRSGDPLGKMSVVEYEFATGSGSLNDDRFGDYASMSVDDQDVFWYTGEYARSNGWATKIVGFKLLRDTFDIGPRLILNPVDGPDLALEEITACVANQGIQPVTTFDIGLITPDGTVITETVTIDTLFTDSLYCHTFSAMLDLTAFGPHQIIVFTSMGLDSNALNDTCIFTVVKQTRWDASIPRIENLQQAICDTLVDFDFVLQNIGVEVLTSVDVVYGANGGDLDTIPWTGALAMGESESIPVLITGLHEADNTIRVFTQLPNGNVDQDFVNDTLEFEVFITPGGQHTTLILLTDNFPEETTWQILDTADKVVLQGGPYPDDQTEYIEEWCLDTSQCYRFVLLDDIGDGIESNGVAGDFQILNGDGIIVAGLDEPSFGFSDTTAFCLQSNCALTGSAFVRHEQDPGAHNGLINILSMGGTPPLQFSIDGGNMFQPGSFFNNLGPGNYVVVVRDGLGCFFSFPVILLPCDIQIMAEVLDASGVANPDGSITFSTLDGSGPVQFSLNGGSFQSNPQYNGLLPGTYNVIVRDSVECEVSTQVMVDFVSGVKTVYFGNIIRVYPNPSDGYFDFEVEGLPKTFELTYEVLTLDGKVVQQGVASNYSGVVKGSFSLLHKPSGEYFLRFRHPALHRLIPIVKL